MKAPAIPKDERYRLDALTSLGLLDTEPDRDFDSLVQLGRDMFQVPTCLVTLVDRDRQWFEARVGLDAPQTSRRVSFCGHAILKDDVFIVLNASKDKRFHDNPLVVGPPHIRFYAGAPIRVPMGYRIGTFCILSPEPRASFGPEEQARLKGFANLTLNAITVRALRARMDENLALATRYQEALHQADTPVAFADHEGIIRECNPAFAHLCPQGSPEGQTIHSALRIRRQDWAPTAAKPIGQFERVVELKKADARIRVARDADGYVLIGR